MVTEDEERYLRQSLLLLKGCRYIGLQVLHRVEQNEIQTTGKDLDSILREWETHLKNKFSAPQRQILLFPADGKTKCETWDIPMISGVLLKCFRPRLDAGEIEAIKTISYKRNSIHAHPSSVSLSQAEYLVVCHDLQQAITILSGKSDQSVKDRCKELVEECLHGPLESQKEEIKNMPEYGSLFKEILRNIETTETEMMRRRTDLTAEVKRLIKEQRDVLKLKVIDSKLEESGKKNEGHNLDLAENLLTKFVEEASRRVGSESGVNQIREAVDEILLEIEKTGLKVKLESDTRDVFPMNTVYDVLPEEILKMDEKALGVFKRALTYGKETDRSIRIMIVGHFGVGKTTLSKHILGDTTGPTQSTNGIDVHIKRRKVQLDTGAWLPVNEDSQHGLQRLANTLRAFSNRRKETVVKTRQKSEIDEKGNPTKTVSDNKESYIQTDSEPNQLIYERVKVEEPVTRSMPTGEKEFLEVIQEIEKRCTTVEKNTCDVSLWDFAGQYVFYCTHQVFLSRRAIYLLVTDLSKYMDSDVQDECNVDSDGVKTCKLSEFFTFWLNSIYTYCGAGETSSPFVIIVGTFADKLPKEQRKEMASKFFTALRETVVDTTTFSYLVDEDFDIDNTIRDSQLDKLKEKIVQVAMNQQWWNEELPVKWVTLERMLGQCKDAGKKVLHREELNAINVNLTVPIDSEEELELFLRFYHDAGMIMYFSDDSLRDFILLDPQWLVDAFKTLITAEQFCSKEKKRLQMWRHFRKTATLSMDLIDSLWKSEGNQLFWENQSTLLLFMEKLGIIARPVPEYSFDVPNSENKFFVPCMLKDPPRKGLIAHLQNKSELCKLTSILCFASESNLIPTHLFNKLIAACICRWRTATLEGKLALFCGFAQFEMEDREHFLSLLFVNNGIQMWINRYSSSGKEEPNQQICAAAKIFIERKLYQEIKERYPITVFWKCSQDDSNAVENMIPFDELLKQKNQRCSVHTGCHIITLSELRFWIHINDISDRIVRGDNSVGYPLRKRVDDTKSERVVHMQREAMRSVGLLIDNGRPCGTVFRVGSKFLMTALHCVKSIKDLENNGVCVDFNISLLLPQRKVYHLTSPKVSDENLDFAVLEISDPDEHLPEALELDKDITDICSEMKSVSLIGYGHPDTLEKTLDPDCTLISAKALRLLENEAEQWLMENKSGYKSALKLKGDDPDLVNTGYRGINTPGKFYFHCFMQHGASGAPAITTLGLKTMVVGMLTHGLPKFYFLLPKALQHGFRRDFLFEVASVMSSIYECLKASEPELAVDLFK